MVAASAGPELPSLAVARSISREELESYRDAAVPDVLGDGCRLLLVGINPGLYTAAVQTHFAHPGNRFWPAIHRAGLTGYEIDRGAGFTDSDRDHLLERGIGITNLVNRATARASELSAGELREGAGRLRRLVEEIEPKVVAIVGVTAYRTAFGRPGARMGRQDEPLGGAELWVVPNPSGLNAHETTDTLTEWYRKVGEAAGIVG